jgi:hypothetical protein
MNKIILITLLFLTGCTTPKQEMILAIHKCETVGLRSVWIHNLETGYVIQCRGVIRNE